MKFNLQRSHLITLFIFSVVFFVLYNFLNFSTPGVFNSPDENANAVLIQQFARANQLAFPLPFEYGRFAEFIHPRSTFVQGTAIVPVGFWGLPVLYGMIAKMIGASGVVFVTPLLTIAAAWALYGIVRHIFNDRIALYSSVAFFVHPAIWYYSARSLFPNMSFVALLIIGTYFLVARPMRTQKLFNDFLGIFFCILSLFIRPNEVAWVGAIFLVIAFAYRRSVTRAQWMIWGIGAIIFAGVLFGVNGVLFGKSVGAYVTSQSLATSHWYSLLLPFGFHSRQIIKSVYFFFVRLPWFFSLLEVIGVAAFVYAWNKHRTTRIQKQYFLISFGVALYLFIYYGSAPDLLFSLKSIGVSYVRYWIPVFILCLPFVVYPFELLRNRVERSRAVNLAFLAIFVLLFLVSGSSVYAGVDGLKSTAGNLNDIQYVREQVLPEFDFAGIIVTDRDDKFFWPKRQVMVRFHDPAIGKAIGEMVQEGWPVYYFTPVLNEEEKQELKKYMAQYGVVVLEYKSLGPHELYEFEKSL